MRVQLEYNSLEHRRIHHSANDCSDMPDEEAAVWEGSLGTTGLEGRGGQKQAGIGHSGLQCYSGAGGVAKWESDTPSPRLLMSKCQLPHKTNAAKSPATLILCGARSEGYRPASSTVGCWSWHLCAGPGLTPSGGFWDLCLVAHKVTSIL